MNLKTIRIVLWAAVGVLAIALVGSFMLAKTSNTPLIAQTAASIGGPFEMVNTKGETVTQDDLKGRKHAMFFGYTFCPDVCPITMQELTTALSTLPEEQAKELDIIFVSVDHERDTPEVLADYMDAFESPARVRGFTGTADQMAAMAKAYRVYYKKQVTNDGDVLFDHTASTFLFDENLNFEGTISFNEKPSVVAKKLQNLITG